MGTLYDSLGLTKNATSAEIKKAYRRLAAKAHPDAGGQREEFEKLTMTKLVLLDPKRRARYDATGEIDAAPDNEMSETVNRIMTAIDTGLRECEIRRIDPSSVNLFDSATKYMMGQIQIGRGNLESLKKGAKQIEKLAKRMKARNGKVNRIVPMFEARKADLERRAEEVEREQERWRKAIEILDEHEFEVERPMSPIANRFPVWPGLGQY